MQVSQLLYDGLLLHMNNVNLDINKFQKTENENIYMCILNYCKLYYNVKECTAYMFSPFETSTIKKELKDVHDFINNNKKS